MCETNNTLDVVKLYVMCYRRITVVKHGVTQR